MKKTILLLLLAFPMFCMGQIKDFEYYLGDGNLQGVKEMIAKGSNVNAQFLFKRTPLQEASWGGYSDIVQYLLDQGANVNAQDANGVSALMDAVWGGHPDIAKVLIAKGADVNAQMPGQVTVYGIAKMKNEMDIVQILKGMHAKETPTYP